MITRTYTFEEVLYQALHFSRHLSKDDPSRERSLVVTNLETACMWNDRVRVLNGLPPLGLDWKP